MFASLNQEKIRLRRKNEIHTKATRRSFAPHVVRNLDFIFQINSSIK